MAWKKAKKVLHVLPAAKMAFEWIWNNLANAWEVYDKATGRLEELRDVHGEIKESWDDVRETLSQDYEHARQFVDNGVSEARETWREMRGKF